MLMRFVHIADLHLDTPLVGLKNNRTIIKKRRAEQKQVVKDIVKMIKDEEIPVLIIAGDVFEQKFVEKKTIEYLINLFQLIPNTTILITPGNHDPLIKNSPYKTFAWPENVHIFDSTISKVSVGDVDFYGYGFENYELQSNQLDDFEVDDASRLNVLVTHANLNGDSKKYNDINAKSLAQFDYVALGHIHLQKLTDSIVYPGSLLSCGFDELGDHGMVIGNFEKGNVTYEFVNMESKHYSIIDVDVTDCKIVSDVLDKLELGEDIYRIVLRGARNIDVKEVREAIFALGKSVCEVRDETHLPYNLEEIAAQKTLKGIFTKKMLKELEDFPNQKELIMKAIEITYNSL
jgi:DNA repair exonuclease SbcCD nuclease subunit